MDESSIRGLLNQHVLSRLNVDNSNVRGQVLYSGLDTLIQGDFYFLGFNPAADGTNPPLKEVPFHREEWSAYLHQCWRKGCGERDTRTRRTQVGCTHPLQPHQLRVQRLASALETRLDKVFAINAVFAESIGVDELLARSDFAELWDGCWELHKVFIAKVQPKWIICLGNSDGRYRSAFDLIKRRSLPKPQVSILGRIKKFQGHFDVGLQNLFECNVAGIPHPSWPALSREVIGQLAQLIH